MSVFMYIIVLLIFLTAVWKNGKKRFFQNVPEPPGNILFGHIFEVISTTNIITCGCRFIENYGKNVQLRIGPKLASLKLILLTTDHKFIEFLLSSNKFLTKSENYEFFKPWLGSGLLLTDGQLWRKHRKIITPAFHFEILKKFVGTFESVGDVLIEKLYENGDSPSIDLHPFVSLCALDIICETAMGTKINAQKGENSEYVNDVKEICKIVVSRCLSPLKIYNWSFTLTKDYYRQKRMLNSLHNFTLQVMKSRIEDLENRNYENGEKMVFLDLLHKYSEDGRLLSYDEIREEVDTFMFRIINWREIVQFLSNETVPEIAMGHDTTSAGICYTLLCLANNPEVQEKVLEEQRELFGEEKNPEINYQELQNMKYLELVIKESLRYYPVIPVVGRYTTEDMEYNGTIIPKNTNIFIFIYGLHRNPEIFPDPEKFDPDRFRNFDSSLPYAYIPFSAGPRNCIGQKYAMLEMKSIVSKVIRHFELIPASPKHNLILAAEVVLKSVNGIRVGLKKRVN